jgi:hypothetical protein
MLKVLEEKGVAASDYVLNDDQVGPGRSQVVFYPTHKAAQFLTQLREEMRYNADWQRVTENLLQRLKDSARSSPAEALRESLSNLSNAMTPLNYCAEMVSVLLLNIQRLKNQNITPILETINLKGDLGLAALAGLSLGSSLTNDADDKSLSEKLLTNTQRFQIQIADMSEESINKLSSFLNDAMLTLRQA